MASCFAVARSSNTGLSGNERRRSSGPASRIRNDVEVHDVLSRSVLRVQSDGGIIAVVGLHVDAVDAAPDRDFPEFRNERSRNALASVLRIDRQVVDVE